LQKNSIKGGIQGITKRDTDLEFAKMTSLMGGVIGKFFESERGVHRFRAEKIGRWNHGRPAGRAP